MTGPQHYREAERLQAHAQELLVTGVPDAGENLQHAAAVLADAQVHATLSCGKRARAQCQLEHRRHTDLA
jgi:hypothetical protein